MAWVKESEIQVRTEKVSFLGHFQTLEEVEAECERLWGPISRCEEEGSIPWFKVWHCQDPEHFAETQVQGFDLTTETLIWPAKCEGDK